MASYFNSSFTGEQIEKAIGNAISAAANGYGETPVHLGAFTSETALFAALDTAFGELAAGQIKQVRATFSWYSTYYPWLIEYYKDAENYGIMRAMSEMYGGSVVYASRNKNGWSRLQWDIPPVWAKVEFCTTEKYDGQSVFTKLVEFGTLPNATTKTYAHGIEGIVIPVSCSLVTKYVAADGTEVWNQAIDTGGTHVSNMYFSTQSVSITTAYDMSDTKGYVMLKYTKR